MVLYFSVLFRRVPSLKLDAKNNLDFKINPQFQTPCT